MRCEDALIHFHTAYSAARNDRRRLQAIERFRSGVGLGEGEAPAEPSAGDSVQGLTSQSAAGSAGASPSPGREGDLFQGQLAADAVRPEREVLLPVLVLLLRRIGRDGAEARSAAAKLLRDLWRCLAPTVSAELFCQFTRRLLKSSLPLPDEDRALLFAAIEGGCAVADPTVVGQLCHDVLAEEGTRCLRSTSDGLQASPTPGFDVLRFVIRCAPAGSWPRLVEELWRLYDLDTDPVMRLTLPELLAMHRSEAGLRKRRRGTDALGLPYSFRPVLRRDRDGQPVRLELCWHTARTMLLRTLAESRPENLGNASPAFFAWLEDLESLPDQELQPLIRPLCGWAVPAMIPVLERWGKLPTLRETFLGAARPEPAFRREIEEALAGIRSALGLGPELVPATAPHGGDSEAAPAPAPAVDGHEPAAPTRGGR